MSELGGFRVVTLQREGAGKAMHTRSWHCHPRLSLFVLFCRALFFTYLYVYTYFAFRVGRASCLAAGALLSRSYSSIVLKLPSSHVICYVETLVGLYSHFIALSLLGLELLILLGIPRVIILARQ